MKKRGMGTLLLEGTFTALVTPFDPEGSSVDYDALDRLVDAQIEGGVSGLVPCGTTGEAPTLTEVEQVEVIRRVVARAKGRVPVLAGTGSFSTKKAIAASRAAVEVGADGVMIVMPYYSKPSQDGMFQYATEVARAVDAPVVLYNVPGRTVADLTTATFERICDAAKNVVGIKDASGNVLRCQEMMRKLGNRAAVMCGDDALTFAMMTLGARGVISVTSNVLPAKTSKVTSLMKAGKLDEARRAQFDLMDVHELMFVEPSPGPAKGALAALGMMNASVRSPIVPASEGLVARIRAAIDRIGGAGA